MLYVFLEHLCLVDVGSFVLIVAFEHLISFGQLLSKGRHATVIAEVILSLSHRRPLIFLQPPPT